MQSSATTILPGATIGMVGGGQLGRMFAMAAAAMGYRVIVLCENESDPAAQVSDGVITGSLDDLNTVREFAQHCDVITLEFENIPAATMAACSEFAPTYPSHSVLATTQNRLTEKGTFHSAGLPVTPFAEVTDTQSLIQFAGEHDWPVIIKSATSGYDGKGQHRIKSEADAAQVDWDASPLWIAEKCIAFEKEISVIVARRPDGVTKCFPAMENDHENHILDVSFCPANVTDQLASEANRVAIEAAGLLDVVGLLCVEMFVISDGGTERLMINEVAPRPHNSGHLTIEGFQTSQFQQHVRAICGLPLGGTELVSGGAAMVNLLGDLWTEGSPDWSKALEVSGVNLHLYGKALAKVGRKMGHMTTTASTAEQACQKVREARSRL